MALYAGAGVGDITDVLSVADVVRRLFPDWPQAGEH
jgi:hypothetical protein